MDPVVIVQFGTITLKLYGGDRVWLQQSDGEGMEVAKVDIEKLLQKYYTDTF